MGNYFKYLIHLLLNLKDQDELSREVILAISYASLTTSIGLFSLVTLGVKGVSDFAFIAGFGNLLAAIYAIIFIPLLISAKDFQVKLRGFRIELGEIKNTLLLL